MVLVAKPMFWGIGNPPCIGTTMTTTPGPSSQEEKNNEKGPTLDRPGRLSWVHFFRPTRRKATLTPSAAGAPTPQVPWGPGRGGDWNRPARSTGRWTEPQERSWRSHPRGVPARGERSLPTSLWRQREERGWRPGSAWPSCTSGRGVPHSLTSWDMPL